MTANGFVQLKEELRWRQQEERPRIIEAISEARAHGDLSENAEYHAAKERQGLVEARLKDIEGIISHALVIDPSTLSGDTVKFGATVMVIPRAIVRDMYTGAQATRLMSSIMLVISVSPMLAPLAGSAVVSFGSWREIFLALAILAAATLTMAQIALPETLTADKRRKVNLRELSRSCGILFRDPVFVGLTFIAGFGMASFFLFISSASFVYTGQFGLTPTEFSLAFAFNAVGFFIATQAAGRLADMWGLATLIGRGVTGFAVCSALLTGVVLAGFGTLPVLLIGLFLAYSFLGVVVPSAMVAALDAHGRRAGMASSLSGSLTMLTGAFCIAATTPFFDGTAVPMVVSIALCGVAALGLVIFTMPKLRQQQEAAAADQMPAAA